YFFDAQNYYPIAIETTQLGQPVSITMSDYQEVEGLYFPFTISQGGQPIDVKKIILNPEIDYSIFSFPEN
ncbi:MAG TPA: outer membrane lipoprotein-sorting protein, partial [Leeuwenhoekiella sp.]|nr:outer membrane lipoprotein-sorting protein [Leeuwenhoekiella sp.]